MLHETNNHPTKENGSASNARWYSFPHEVVEDPSLSTSQKREILSEWASDACAIESFPTLRLLPGTSFPVTYSAIIDARQRLDQITERAEAAKRPGQCVAANIVVADFSRQRQAQGPDRH